MDCKTVFIRLAEIRRTAKRAEIAIKEGNNLQCYRLLDVIGLHVQTVRAELNTLKQEAGK